MRALLPAPMLALLLALATAAVPLASAGAGEDCDGRVFESGNVLGPPICLPEAIDRVVVLSPFYNLVMGKELDLPIVGAASAGILLSDAAASERAAGIENIGTIEEPNLEIITRLAPDLILGDAYMHAQRREILAKIAPTALVSAGDWKSYFRTIAAIAGREARAEALLADYEARVADIAARLPDVTLSYVRIMPAGLQVYVQGPNAYAPFRILEEVGVRRTPYETVSDDTILKRPGWEEMIALQGDVLFYVVSGDGEQRAALEAETLSHPIWRLLPAVRGGRVHRVDPGTWSGFGGIASAHAVLDDVERHLVDPAR